MPKRFTSSSQKTGELGEILSERFLMKQGFTIIERNYTIPMGEIDIIARKEGILRFIEVKSIKVSNVSDETIKGLYGTSVRPEENLHPKKLRSLYRTIQVYMSDNNVLNKGHWQIDLLCAYIDIHSHEVKFNFLENVIES